MATICCSFCDKKADDVRHLMMRSEGDPTAICDECVLMCVEIIFRRRTIIDFRRPAPSSEEAAA